MRSRSSRTSASWSALAASSVAATSSRSSLVVVWFFFSCSKVRWRRSDLASNSSIAAVASSNARAFSCSDSLIVRAFSCSDFILFTTPWWLSNNSSISSRVEATSWCAAANSAAFIASSSRSANTCASSLFIRWRANMSSASAGLRSKFASSSARYTSLSRSSRPMACPAASTSPMAFRLVSFSSAACACFVSSSLRLCSSSRSICCCMYRAAAVSSAVSFSCSRLTAPWMSTTFPLSCPRTLSCSAESARSWPSRSPFSRASARALLATCSDSSSLASSSALLASSRATKRCLVRISASCSSSLVDVVRLPLRCWSTTFICSPSCCSAP
mmetsp:Transcript_53722/g.107902  ORF Transcript_53722/g.107902 Transcript_53722/m.107902 type:complete len:330 (+) Transcript_53722:1444-2433(+)